MVVLLLDAFRLGQGSADILVREEYDHDEDCADYPRHRLAHDDAVVAEALREVECAEDLAEELHEAADEWRDFGA